MDNESSDGRLPKISKIVGATPLGDPSSKKLLKNDTPGRSLCIKAKRTLKSYIERTCDFFILKNRKNVNLMVNKGL